MDKVADGAVEAASDSLIQPPSPVGGALIAPRRSRQFDAINATTVLL
jgi:hypothetical protein